MLRNIAEPVDAGGLEADIRIKPPRHRPMDDGLLLLLKERDEFLLGLDIPPNLPVGMIQKPHDGGLLCERWKTAIHLTKFFRPKTPLV